MKGWVVVVSAHRWITAGEQSGFERSARLERGETSVGEIPGTVEARNKASKLELARKPLRG
jgi:hypothetical protein